MNLTQYLSAPDWANCGLLGHQVGGGNGKTLATAGGAVAGGYGGNRVQKHAQDGRTYYTTEYRCYEVDG